MNPVSNEGDEKQVLLPIAVPPAPAVQDLECVCTWHPASTPPHHGLPVCVSTPDLKDTHQIAEWSLADKCFLFAGERLVGVTYWTNLPYSPEYMASHPDEFEDSNASKTEKFKP